MITKLPKGSIAWASWAAAALAVCGNAAAQTAIGPSHRHGLAMDWKVTEGYPGIPFLAEAFAVTRWDPDGTGPLAPRLVAAGAFDFIADRVVNSVAAFLPETGEWDDLGGGVDPGFPNVLCTFQDDLIVAGGFTSAGGVAALNIARWDGAFWSALGSGITGTPIAMTVFNGELIVAGIFASAGGVTVNNIARWNGASWQTLGSPAGMNSSVFALAVYDGELIAVGNFTSAGGVPAHRIARWNGSRWQSLGSGMNNGTFGLAVLGDDLYAGGNATVAGGVTQTNGVARWDGTSWHAVPGIAFFGVTDLAVYQGDLIVGGGFDFAGGVPAFNVARWDGSQWHAMGAGTGVIESMAVFQSSLYVSVSTGSNGMQRWDGSAWHAVPNGPNNLSMTVWDGKLISGFSDPLAFDGNAWTVLPGWSYAGGTGFLNYVVFEGDLIIGGGFQDAGGNPEADGLVRFDGASWHAMDTATGTPGGGMFAGWVHNGELVSDGGVFHADGRFSNWRRFGW